MTSPAVVHPGGPSRCRNQKVDDYLHQASRYLVNLLVDQEITTLVIGKNDGWKQEVKMTDILI